MQFETPPGATRCAFYGTFPRRWELGVIAPTQLLTIERDDGVANRGRHEGDHDEGHPDHVEILHNEIYIIKHQTHKVLTQEAKV